MIGNYCVLNGKLIKTNDATIMVDHIEFAYGFAVYENIKLSKGTIHFLHEHINRLFNSATMIGLNHDLKKHEVEIWTQELVQANGIESSNIKMILIGGQKPFLYIFQLAPKYLEKKEYREGIKVITYEYERFLPQAKTLNMLPSYIIYKKAQEQHAYDALLIDRDGDITEGTRSNFFTIKEKTLYTPPLEKILEGVTRKTVLACAQENEFKIIEENISLAKVFTYDGAFLTNTSGGIVPIKTIDGASFVHIPEKLAELKKSYDIWLQKNK